ncbi:MotA/TolQ/ExbB proton channel family protein [Marinobacter sp. SS8-8]|uniref:MotA/TolQ/ExbB proton channel family protein n=1 Tax=Marinobacter sp. SS8-8 TaxID=3050452 RepID=UPI000C4B8124|nr:MotA/TolQ/ExbB proton channel family protein [Marinobacter sp. SS8-8]MAZ05941.1 flagellar motor protein MotA [Halomonas sp.]|tara:strand:- start:1006 stop:1794 length:789 start_codon:yes stop_codon:yes gene_type:complete
MTDIFPPLSNGLLAQLTEMGGPVMVVLLVIALLGAVTFIYLMLLGTLYAPRLPGSLKKTVIRWQQNPGSVSPGAIREQAGRWGRLNPLLHLVTNTIEALNSQQDERQIRETAARDAQQSLEPFEAPLKIIEVIAALAPLLGLLGTVLGMMDAFSAMAATEGRANASQLSGGIYEALTTTAAGLVVAIPFAALAAWVEFRLRRIHKTINSTLVSILNVTVDRDAEARADALQAVASRECASTPPAADLSHDSAGSRRFAHATG